jgi:hypothetical protein
MTSDDTPAARFPGPVLILCRVCELAAGFWSPSDPLCPRCWAVLNEAGE